jgi:hypothetical protein
MKDEYYLPPLALGPTPCSRVLLKKLIVSQQITKIVLKLEVYYPLLVPLLNHKHQVKFIASNLY